MSSEPRPSWLIRRQLSDLENIFKTVEAKEGPDAVDRLGLRSLKRHEELLQEEFAMALRLEFGSDEGAQPLKTAKSP